MFSPLYFRGLAYSKIIDFRDNPVKTRGYTVFFAFVSFLSSFWGETGKKENPIKTGGYAVQIAFPLYFQ